MTTYATFKDLVYTNIARDSTDASAVLIVPKAVNYAIDAAAILFKPQELYTQADLVVTTGNASKQFTTKFIDIVDIYNLTSSLQMLSVPYEARNLIIPTSTTLKYFSMFGDWMFFNATAAVDTSIRVGYIEYPTELSADADEVAFTRHDAYIVSMATAFCWAAFEEGESIDVWSKVGDALGMSLIKAAQAREIVAGKPVLIETPITGSLAGAR